MCPSVVRPVAVALTVVVAVFFPPLEDCVYAPPPARASLSPLRRRCGRCDHVDAQRCPVAAAPLFPYWFRPFSVIRSVRRLVHALYILRGLLPSPLPHAKHHAAARASLSLPRKLPPIRITFVWCPRTACIWWPPRRAMRPPRTRAPLALIIRAPVVVVVIVVAVLRLVVVRMSTPLPLRRIAADPLSLSPSRVARLAAVGVGAALAAVCGGWPIPRLASSLFLQSPFVFPLSAGQVRKQLFRPG